MGHCNALQCHGTNQRNTLLVTMPEQITLFCWPLLQCNIKGTFKMHIEPALLGNIVQETEELKIKQGYNLCIHNSTLELNSMQTNCTAIMTSIIWQKFRSI